MEENKLFVVIIVLTTVLAGLAVYLFRLDRRISKMEKQIKDDRKQA